MKAWENAVQVNGQGLDLVLVSHREYGEVYDVESGEVCAWETVVE